MDIYTAQWSTSEHDTGFADMLESSKKWSMQNICPKLALKAANVQEKYFV